MQTDNEQLDQFKTFLKENGIAITVGVVIGVGGLLGWNFYQSHQIKTLQNEATAYYETISTLDTVKKIETKEGSKEAEAGYAEINEYLKSNKSNYVAVVALAYAKELVTQKAFGEAEKVLSETLPKIQDKNLMANVEFMIAHIQAEQQKYDEAIQTLAKTPVELWGSDRFDLKADILKRKGDIPEAKKLYEQAINVADPALQEYLRIKLNNLPS